MRKIYYKLNRILFKIYNLYIKLFFIFGVSNENKKILRENQKYKKCHKGKRCFILGNGPSLKDIDLKLLKNEIVFTVNQINRHPDFVSLNSSYHFWLDPNFFMLDSSSQEDLELLSFMKSIGKTKKTQCFFPIEQKEFCIKNGIEDEMNISYFSSKIRFYDSFDEKIDFSKVAPNFGTVVQLSISMAIYMGFTEIYLLGCDNTGLMVTMKSILKCNDNEDYVYSITANEKRRMEKILEKNSLENYTKSYLNTLCDYRRLNEYCKKNNIALVNCSSHTVIDSLPRNSIENILNLGD